MFFFICLFLSLHALQDRQHHHHHRRRRSLLRVRKFCLRFTLDALSMECGALETSTLHCVASLDLWPNKAHKNINKKILR